MQKLHVNAKVSSCMNKSDSTVTMCADSASLCNTYVEGTWLRIFTRTKVVCCFFLLAKIAATTLSKSSQQFDQGLQSEMACPPVRLARSICGESPSAFTALTSYYSSLLQ